MVNRNNSLRKSAEKEKTQTSDAISEAIVDDYEDDFVEESVRNPAPVTTNKQTNNVFANNNNINSRGNTQSNFNYGLPQDTEQEE